MGAGPGGGIGPKGGGATSSLKTFHSNVSLPLPPPPRSAIPVSCGHLCMTSDALRPGWRCRRMYACHCCGPILCPPGPNPHEMPLVRDHMHKRTQTCQNTADA